MNNCFESLFFLQLFQETYFLSKSRFIVIHIPGDFDKLKRYKRSYLKNKQFFFPLIVLARTERIREKKKSTSSNVYLNEAGRDLFGCLSNSQFMFRNTLIKTEHGKSSSYSHLFFFRFKGPELPLETKKLSTSPLDSFQYIEKCFISLKPFPQLWKWSTIVLTVYLATYS